MAALLTVVAAFGARLVRNKKIFGNNIVADVNYLQSLRIKGDYYADSVSAADGKDGLKIARIVVQAIKDKIAGKV